MPSTKDKQNRPVVVVTGMGVVTSLGAGKAETGRSSPPANPASEPISRFPTDGLKTTIAGTVDFVDVEPYSTAGAVRAAGRHRRRGSDRAKPASASAAISRARCFSPCRRSRSNGRSA